MPRYKVLSPGFHDGKLYKPEHPRNHTVTTDEPFKKVPSWLKKIKDETAAEKKKRIAAEKASNSVDTEKADQDRVDTDAMTFIEPAGSNVETL